MAVPNMIVTLLARTDGYSRGLKNAAHQTTTFGTLAKRGLGIAAGAVAALGAAVVAFIPDLVRLGIESRRADVRLAYVAKNMAGMGKATDAAVARLKTYAEKMAYATGIDDEQIKAVQAKILTFKVLERTVGKAGGTFDRVTKAAFDLVAVGFGDAESNAVRLARMMQDPIKNIGLFKRAGIEFTQAEQDKIQALMDSNDLIGAQEVLLGRIEKKVGGVAKATADPLAKMGQRFQNIGEDIGTALLPYLDKFTKQFGDWISSPQGTAAIKEFVGYFQDFGKWATSKDGQDSIKSLIKGFSALLQVLIKIGQLLDYISGAGTDKLKKSAEYWKTVGGIQDQKNFPWGTGNYSYDKTGGTTLKKPGSTVINFNAPVDSVSAGREVQRVLNAYNRASGR